MLTVRSVVVFVLVVVVVLEEEAAKEVDQFFKRLSLASSCIV